MNRCIVIKTQFEAIHCWPDCDIKEVSFLKYPHRHIFHVMMKWKVTHDNRDKEFIQIKRRVNDFTYLHFDQQDLGHLSCEMIADMLHDAFPGSFFISVFEDDENGVEVIYD